MNAQMRLIIMLTSVAVSGSLLFAAETPPPAAEPAEKPAVPTAAPKAEAPKSEQKAEAPKSEPKAESTASEDPVRAEDQDPAPKRAATAAEKAASPQRFTPSEQVRADFPVSFPIDI